MEHKAGIPRTLTSLLRRSAHGVYGFLYEKDPDFFPSYVAEESKHATTQH